MLTEDDLILNSEHQLLLQSVRISPVISKPKLASCRTAEGSACVPQMDEASAAPPAGWSSVIKDIKTWMTQNFLPLTSDKLKLFSLDLTVWLYSYSGWYFLGFWSYSEEPWSYF